MPVLAANVRMEKRGSLGSSKSDDERKEIEDSGTESDQIEQNQMRSEDDNSTSANSISSDEEMETEASKDSIQAESRYVQS